MHLPQLVRIRWAVRATLMLGVAASVVANVLHAMPNPISQAISAWPPLALLLTVELTSRIPMHRRTLAALRVGATGIIASIAAWVSYWHMQDVAVRYGETESMAYLLPISVDGLIVVASVSLVELAGRIRLLEDLRAKARETGRELGETVTTARVGASVAPVRFVQPPAPVEEADATEDEADFMPDPARLPAAPVSPAVVPMAPVNGSAHVNGTGHVNGSTPSAPRASGTRAAVSTPPRTVVTAATSAADPATPRQRRPALETAELADAIEALNPDISPAELAKQLGITVTRLKAVRREAEELRKPGASRVLAQRS